MALRFIYFMTSELQNIEYRTAACDELSRVESSKDGQVSKGGNALLSLFKIDRIHYSMFDVGRSMFDVH